MVGTRNTWRKLLPVIQAFVNGEQIQRLNYDNRWVDIENLYSVLHNTFRVKPKSVIEGVWLVQYKYEDNSVSKVTGAGTLYWKGNSDEYPKWPSSPKIKLLKETENFTPNPVQLEVKDENK